MLSKNLTLKALYVFMMLILLFGLLQPGLVLAADTSEEDNIQEQPAEEMEVVESEAQEETEENAENSEVPEEAEENDEVTEEVEETAEEVETPQEAEDIEAEAADESESDEGVEVPDESEEAVEEMEEAEVPQESENKQEQVAPKEAENVIEETLRTETQEMNDTEIDFNFELRPDSISQWDLARSGVELAVYGPSDAEGTITIAGETIAFEVQYHVTIPIIEDLSPGMYPVTVTIGNTSKTQDLIVESDDDYWEESVTPNVTTGRTYVLTKSEAEEQGTIRGEASGLQPNSSYDFFLNGDKIEMVYSDGGTVTFDIDISDLPTGDHTVELNHPTGSGSTTFSIVPDSHGTAPSAGVFEGLTYQYMAGSVLLDNPFELPIRFEVDGNGMLQNAEIEYWWVCAPSDGASGFNTAVNFPATQITVGQPFQVDWTSLGGDYSLIGMVNDDGTASGKFINYGLGCGNVAADWNLVSDQAPEPVPEEFEVDLSLDTTEETEGPVTITIATTSDAAIESLKWLAGERTEEEFVNAGNEIDLETMAFSVDENGAYTVYALNADGVAALSTISVNNIIEPGPDPDPEPEDPPAEQEIDFNETVEVLAGQLIKVIDTSISVQLPEDLPEGTQLTIHRVDQGDKAGDVVEVNLQLPQGSENFEGTYVLTLGIDDEYAHKNVAIFYFNEDTEEWENIGGEIDHDNQTISVSLHHFSIYGVFAIEDDDVDPGDGDRGDGEPGDGADPDDVTEPGDDTNPADGPDPADGAEPGDDTDAADGADTHDEAGSDNRTDADGTANTLPATATNLYNLLFIGGVLLLLGVGLLLIRRRQNA